MTIFDVRHYEAGKQAGDWNYDVPTDVQRELMECAKAQQMSMDYLCAIYRKGRTDGAAASQQEIERLKRISDAAFHAVMQYNSGTEESTRQAMVELDGFFQSESDAEAALETQEKK